MSLDTLDRSSEYDEVQSRHAEAAIIEAPRLDEKSPEEFGMEAREFFSQERTLIAKYIDQRHPTPREAARAELFRDRIQNAEFKETGQLADILYAAPIASQLHDFLNNAKQKLRDRDSLSPTEIVPLQKQVEVAKRNMVVFNHKLRDFLFENGGHILQEEMTQWLSRAMGNKDLTARTIVHGMGAEVAVARLLDESGRKVQFSSVDQDLRGTDLIVYSASGRAVEVDIKTGGGQGDGNSRSRGTEIDVDSRMHRDFAIQPEYRRELLSTIDSL